MNRRRINECDGKDSAEETWFNDRNKMYLPEPFGTWYINQITKNVGVASCKELKGMKRKLGKCDVNVCCERIHQINHESSYFNI